jgi:hypothetical protein
VLHEPEASVGVWSCVGDEGRHALLKRHQRDLREPVVGQGVGHVRLLGPGHLLHLRRAEIRGEPVLQHVLYLQDLRAVDTVRDVGQLVSDFRPVAWRSTSTGTPLDLDPGSVCIGLWTQRIQIAQDRVRDDPVRVRVEEAMFINRFELGCNTSIIREERRRTYHGARACIGHGVQRLLKRESSQAPVWQAKQGRPLEEPQPFFRGIRSPQSILGNQVEGELRSGEGPRKPKVHDVTTIEYPAKKKSPSNDINT